MKNKLVFSKRGDSLIGQEMFHILERANELERNGEHVCHLELGEPKMYPPGRIINKTIISLLESKVGYSPSGGLLALRKEISSYYHEKLNIIINKVKNGYSIALMVDQRVGEGSRIPFFNLPALTTTVPAQLALKYNCKLVPISLERKGDINFEMTVHEPYEIQKTGNVDADTNNITLKINQIIEKMIIKNPTQWLWSHNRWK